MSQNTPTTQILNPIKKYLATLIPQEDAEFIVRAVNSHEELLAAVKILMESTRHAYNCPEKDGGACNCGFHDAITMGAKAIAKAEARP